MARILITGAGKGIGYTTALLLARRGHDVLATMRRPEASDLAKVASDAKLPLTVLPMDVDDDASVTAAFARAGSPVDVLVNNAGILSVEAVEDERLETFRRVMETNYFGVIRCIHQVLPGMRARRAGCIVNVSSVAGRIAFFAQSAYAASKWALEALSESLAQEVRGFGIRVAIVEPGIIDTAMATTSLPAYSAKSAYPHGRRVHAFFRNPAKPEASPDVAAEMIRHAIESDDPRLRYPVGPDAHPFLGWRGATSDEDWVGMSGLDDAAYFDRVYLDTGVDLRPGR